MALSADFSRNSAPCASEIDQWILDYLSIQAPSGAPLPLSNLFDQVADIHQLIGVQTRGRFIQDEYVGIMNQSLGKPNTLFKTFG